MDSYKGHIIVGVICVSIIFFLFDIFEKMNVWQWILLGVIVPYYSVLPDIDQKQSKAREWTTTVGILFSLMWLILFYFQRVMDIVPVISVLAFLAFLWTMRYFNIFFKEGEKPFAHRGIWHGVVFGVITSSVLLVFGWIVALGGFLGYGSHLVADKISSLVS